MLCKRVKRLKFPVIFFYSKPNKTFREHKRLEKSSGTTILTENTLHPERNHSIGGVRMRVLQYYIIFSCCGFSSSISIYLWTLYLYNPLTQVKTF